MCSKELTFFNQPLLPVNVFSDGTKVCAACFTKIDSKMAISLKKYTLADVERSMQSKGVSLVEQNKRLAEIRGQIAQLGFNDRSAIWGRKEIDELPRVLGAEEKVDNLVLGMYNNALGMLISTDRRLIFIDKGMVALKVEDFPLDKISSIQYETGVLFGSITIHTSANIAMIDKVEKESARRFAEGARDKLSRPKAATAANVVQPSVLEQLEKLGKLKDSGILSEAEFDEQKKKLLERL